MEPSPSRPSLALDESCREIYCAVDVGDSAPDFTLPSIEGDLHSLSQHRGKKVMLSFYRDASCPFCNLAIDQLKGWHKKLAWAAELDVITIFQSPAHSIKKHILDGDRDYPFIPLADPEQEIYKQYDVKASWRGFVYGNVVVGIFGGKFFKALRQGHLIGKIEGKINRLPSDYLIDENGTIVDCFHARDITEHIPLDRIDRFLMGKRGNP